MSYTICLIYDDFDEGYFGGDSDDGDAGDGPANALRGKAEQKRVHIMGLF